jgi:hypothetical protein
VFLNLSPEIVEGVVQRSEQDVVRSVGFFAVCHVKRTARDMQADPGLIDRAVLRRAAPVEYHMATGTVWREADEGFELLSCGLLQCVEFWHVPELDIQCECWAVGTGSHEAPFVVFTVQ